MTVVQFLVVLFVYPETKGQTLEQLQRKLVAAGLGLDEQVGTPIGSGSICDPSHRC